MTKASKGALWLAICVAAVVAIALYQHFGLGRLLTLESLKVSRDTLSLGYQNQPWLTLGLFFASYVAATALSIPGAVVLTLAAGALFGLWVGLLVVSFASSLGALLAFLSARHLLRDAIQSRFGK
jgi:uncharacterized membrane protein YdjX (TVP38/TMEM64 family)